MAPPPRPGPCCARRGSRRPPRSEARSGRRRSAGRALAAVRSAAQLEPRQPAARAGQALAAAAALDRDAPRRARPPPAQAPPACAAPEPSGHSSTSPAATPSTSSAASPATTRPAVGVEQRAVAHAPGFAREPRSLGSRRSVTCLHGKTRRIRPLRRRARPAYRETDGEYGHDWRLGSPDPAPDHDRPPLGRAADERADLRPQRRRLPASSPPTAARTSRPGGTATSRRTLRSRFRSWPTRSAPARATPSPPRGPSCGGRWSPTGRLRRLPAADGSRDPGRRARAGAVGVSDHVTLRVSDRAVSTHGNNVEVVSHNRWAAGSPRGRSCRRPARS